MAEQIIVSDPNIMMGKPTVVGTRITVELIVKKLAATYSIEELLDGYPRLTRESITAALEYAAKCQDWPPPAA